MVPARSLSCLDILTVWGWGSRGLFLSPELCVRGFGVKKEVHRQTGQRAWDRRPPFHSVQETQGKAVSLDAEKEHRL